MRRGLSLLLATLVVGGAGGPPKPENWPCVQRYVPTLAGGMVWPNFVPSDDWRSNPDASALVSAITDRMMPLDEATKKLRAWAASHPGPEARAQLFAGLVAGINDARSAAIERIRDIDRRLQGLADANSRAVAELAALPAGAPASQREAITERRLLIIREFDSINRVVRYACEIPPDYEGRLGQFAKILRPATQ